MQERQIQTFLAYVWALGIVPTQSIVSADGQDLVPNPDETQIFDADAIKTEAELQAALSDPDTVAITLASDIITLEDLVVNRNDSIELNLNGFKIASLAQNARVIDVQAGDIAILGLGSIVATGIGASAIRVKGAMTADNVNYSRLTVGADVTLYAPNYYGIFVTTNYNAAYGVAIDFYGSIIAHDGICIHGNIQGRGDNIPHLNIQDGAKIIADENDGSALCAFGIGTWEIGAAELTGGIGLNAKSGLINLRGANLIATGGSDAFPGSGAVIRLEDNFARHIKLKIFGGSYLSVQGYTFYEHAELSGIFSLQNLEIYDGIFSGQLGICFGLAPRGSENAATCIYGGKFNADVSRYLAPEHHIEQNSTHSEYAVIDDTEPTEILDKAAQLKLARTNLEELISIAKRYTKASYAGNELGEVQATVNKIIGAIKRGIKASEKLLKSPDVTLAKVKNSIRRLEDHLSEIRAIEDAMRAEISEAIDPAQFDASRYTEDSLLDLTLATADAKQLLASDFVTLVELQDMLGVIDAAKIMLEESDEYVDRLADEDDFTVAAEGSSEIPAITPTISESLEVAEAPLEAAPEVALPIDLPLPEMSELPLRPAPKLFPSLPSTESSTDIERVLDSFVDDVEEPVDPVEAAFVVDDLEMEEMSEVETFVDQLQAAELLTLSVPEETFAEPELASATSAPEPPSESMSQPSVPELAPTYLAPEPPVPVFVDPELTAAKQSLRDLLNALSVLNPADYTTESYTILARTASMAGNLLVDNSHHTTTAVLISAFNSVNVAYGKLVKKSENPTGTALETVEQNLRSMLDAVQDLTVNDYEIASAEQFGELQVAIAKAKAVLSREDANLSDLLNIMDEIKLATSGLKGSATSAAAEPELELEPELASIPTPVSTSAVVEQPVEPVEPAPVRAVENDTFIVHQPVGPVPVALDWNDFSEALNDVRALNAAEYTSESYQKLLAVLENAKILSGKTNLTQEEIDEIVFELNLAILALERPVAPRLSETQTFAEPTPAPRATFSSADVGQMNNHPASAAQSPTLAADDTITPSLLMSMMAGAYAGLATYRRSRLEAKKRKQFDSV